MVDARAGPGIKSLTKFKAKNKKKTKEIKDEKFDKIPKKKHVYMKSDRDREQSPAMSDDTGLDNISSFWTYITCTHEHFCRREAHTAFSIELIVETS